MPINNHNDFLNAVAEAIDISPEMAERAQKHYESIGNWLDRDASTISRFSPEIYTQGSFRLGTVIRPIGDNDEFDIDLVCEVKATANDFSTKMLKDTVGEELNGYAYANSMNHDPEEKRRCWTMEYADQEKFHLDILPAIPRDPTATTAIGITDNEQPEYHNHRAEWLPSNPKGYAEWFDAQQSVALTRTRGAIFEGSIYDSVEDVPTHLVKTPLQRCIQLLKRHRDSMFGNDEDKPISIIITTLSAHAYSKDEEETLEDALETVLNNMHTFIYTENQVEWVANPVDDSENFADKWAEHPERATKFYEWLEQARRDFGEYLHDPFNNPNGDFIKCISQKTFDKVAATIIESPAIISQKERAESEAIHRETEGDVHKPWRTN